MKHPLFPLFSIAVLLAASGPLRADVSLPAIFSDHAVLQRSERTSVWGTAAPGEKVSVALAESRSAEAIADAAGRWTVALDLRAAPEVPLELVVRGRNTVAVKDVVVGDVWFCSGQSNMEWKLAQTTGAQAEIEASANPRLRCFLPRRQAPAEPAENLSGQWLVAGPDTAGKFSGIAYYFAKTVQAAVPGAIGLVDTSWGGTPAEAWISSAGLDRVPGVKARKDEILAEQPRAESRLRQFAADYEAWATRQARTEAPPADIAAYAAPDVDLADWRTVTLPGPLSAAGLPDSGVVWLRRDVEIAPNRAGTYLPLLLGELHDFETVYWNGRRIGETSPATSTSINPDTAPTRNRRYDVPGAEVKAGRNVLAIRLSSPGGDAGIAARRMNAAWSIPLDGEWRAKVEQAFTPLAPEALASYPRRPPWPIMPHYVATYLYNGLVHPLRSLGLRGVIWYQGEANVGRAYEYRTTFPRLIEDWRATFGRPDLPFYFCQLANYQAKKAEPAESAWAELREAQARALALPHTGMAVLIDQGEEEDIHPRDKRKAGARLAAVALADTYGRKVAFAGPTLRSATPEGERLRLRFDRAEGGLTARPLPASYRPKSTHEGVKPLLQPSPRSEVQGFAICGLDGRWIWAQAKIEGDAVVVWADGVPAPRFVRYAWADNPTCNLYNAAGLPAAPFRTDDFPPSTKDGKF